MGTTQTRILKQDWLISHIVAAGKRGYKVSEKKLIAEFCIKCASSEKTALELLKHLEILGLISRKNKEIWSKEAWEAEQVLNRARLNGAK
jgi:hypothetical protein